MKVFLIAAAVLGSLLVPSIGRADERPLERPFVLTYDRASALDVRGVSFLPERASASGALAFARQDPPPDPDVFMLADVTFSSSGKFHQINRIERRYHDYGNGFFASVTTGTGWRLEDGVPVVAPLGIWWSGEVRVDFLVFMIGFGGDMVVPQGERVGVEIAAKIGFRIAID